MLFILSGFCGEPIFFHLKQDKKTTIYKESSHHHHLHECISQSAVEGCKKKEEALLTGVEPVTSGLTVPHSNQLSCKREVSCLIVLFYVNYTYLKKKHSALRATGTFLRYILNIILGCKKFVSPKRIITRHKSQREDE